MILSIDLYQDLIPGLPLNLLIRFAVILIVSIVFRGLFARFLAKLFYILFKKFSSEKHIHKFKELLQKPIQAVITSILCFIAFNQLNDFFDDIILFERHKLISNATASEDLSTSISLLELIDHVFFFAFIFYFVLLVARVISFLFFVWVDRAIIAEDREKQQLLPLLRDVLIVLAWSFGFFTVLGLVFHVNVPTLIAGLGFGGVALAFAAKESIENLLASFMIMLDKPFTLGDHIKLGNVEGTVETLGFRSTRIRTFDKTLVSIPNKNLIGDSLENFTQRGLMRVKLTLDAVYGTSQTSLKNVMNAIKAFLVSYEYTSDESRVFLENFGGALEIHLSYYIIIPTEKSLDDIKQEVHLEIYKIMYEYVGGFAFPTNLQINGSDINNVEVN
jgi:MscS family membrane protein